MTPEEAIAKVRKAFERIPRPDLFIRGTCTCDECMEHNETLASHTPDTITLKELGNAGWDPICFASDSAFAYYLPAMLRLAVADPSYLDQLLFHCSIPDRLDALDQEQAKCVLEVLWALTDQNSDLIAGTPAILQLEQAMRTLEQKIGSKGSSADSA